MSVKVEKCWSQRVSKLLPRLKCGNLEEKFWNFNFPAAAILPKKYCPRQQLTSGTTRCQTRHSGPNTTSVAPHSLLPAPKQSESIRATCRGVIDKAIASPAVHKCMTGKCMLEVFGGSRFVAKATNHLGLRGYGLDTKFGPWCDVTRPLVLTTNRQDASAGKCVAAMISPPRLHTTCSSQVILASASIAICFIGLPCRGFWNTRVIRGCGTRRNSKLLRRRPRTAWTLADCCIFGSQHNMRVARKCNGTGGHCSVSGQKHGHPKASASRSECGSSRYHSYPHRLSRALAVVRTMDARGFHRTHPLGGMGSSLNESKDTGMGVTALAPVVNQTQ